MRGGPFTIARIKHEVAKHYGVTMAQLESSHRTQDITRPRMVAYCLATRLTEHGYSRIGHFFGGRDHSTVWHGSRVAEARDKQALRTLTKQILIEAGPCV